MGRQLYTGDESYVVNKDADRKQDRLRASDIVCCTAAALLSIVFAVVGIFMFRSEFENQYAAPDGSVPQGKVVHEKVTVTDVTLRTDREMQENAEVMIDRWHLVADTGLVLNEGYIDEEYASAMKGMTRNVVIDSGTGGELLNRGMHPWFAIPFGCGVACLIVLVWRVVAMMRYDYYDSGRALRVIQGGKDNGDA